MNIIDVEYTGSYPTLCFGKWIIKIDGKVLTLPSNNHFYTKGIYTSWHFEGWMEVFEDYEDGLSFPEWKIDPPNQLIQTLELQGYAVNDKLLLNLYDKIQKCDWRHNSCGGCI